MTLTPTEQRYREFAAEFHAEQAAGGVTHRAWEDVGHSSKRANGRPPTSDGPRAEYERRRYRRRAAR